MRDLFTIGNSFIHYPVCKMSRKDAERRIEARIVGAAGFGEGPQRRVAQLMWLMGSNGSSERARKMIPEATAGVEALAQRTSHVAGPWLELIARYTKRVGTIDKAKETAR